MTETIDTVASHDVFERKVTRVIETLDSEKATVSEVQSLLLVARTDKGRPFVLEGCRRWLALAIMDASARLEIEANLAAREA